MTLETVIMETLPTRIFLLGYMGSGKSTLGRELAQLLGYRFVDLDEWIENRACMSVSDMFDLKGEAYFRDMESESLQHLINEEAVVVGLGGGTPCFNDNMDLITELGFSVFLNPSITILTQRLKEGKAQRPLIAKIDDHDLPKFIETQLLKRLPFYERATVIVEKETTGQQLKAIIKDSI